MSEEDEDDVVSDSYLCKCGDDYFHRFVFTVDLLSLFHLQEIQIINDLGRRIDVDSPHQLRQKK